MGGTSWRPGRAVQVIAGTPPGGGLDRAAQALVRAICAEGLLDVPLAVVNVPGEGARKAWRQLDACAGDAHVLCISSPNLATDRLLGLAPGDLDRYTPLSILYTEYIAFAVRADSPLRNGSDVAARLAATAGAMTVALATSRGNPNHVALARIARCAGVDPRAPVLRVFDGALDAVGDVIAGGSELAAVTAASTISALAAGEVRLVGITAPHRLPGPFSDVPTWREAGIDCLADSWRGVAAPAAIDSAASAFWRAVLAAATRSAAWQAELARHGWSPLHVDGPALAVRLAAEREEMRAALTALGMAAAAS